MAVRGYGSTMPRLLPETGILRKKRNGITEGEAKFECMAASRGVAGLQAAAALIDDIDAEHPFAQRVYMERREMIYGPGWVTANCWYGGVLDEDLDQPVYDLQVGVDEQPIEVHRKFVSDIGGQPSSPLNGALFVDASGQLTTSNLAGTFGGFAAVVSTGPGTFGRNAYAGIEAYLEASSVSYRQSYCSRSLPLAADGNAVGFIATPPGPVPFLGDRNWLYCGYTFRERGRRYGLGSALNLLHLCYEITREWKLSGLGGWNPTIYSA